MRLALLMLSVLMLLPSSASAAGLPEPDHIGLEWTKTTTASPGRVVATAVGVAYDDGERLVKLAPDGRELWVRPASEAAIIASDNWVWRYSLSGSTATVSAFNAATGEPGALDATVEGVSSENPYTWKDHLYFGSSSGSWPLRVAPDGSTELSVTPTDSTPLGTFDDIVLRYVLSGTLRVEIGANPVTSVPSARDASLLVDRRGRTGLVVAKSHSSLDLVSRLTLAESAPPFPPQSAGMQSGSRAYGTRLLMWNSAGTIAGARSDLDGCAPHQREQTNWSRSLSITIDCPPGTTTTIEQQPHTGSSTLEDGVLVYRPATDHAGGSTTTLVRAERAGQVQFVQVSVAVGNQAPACTAHLDSVNASTLSGHLECTDPEGLPVSLQESPGATTGSGLSFTVDFTSGTVSRTFRPDTHAVTAATPTIELRFTRNADVACIDYVTVTSDAAVHDVPIPCVTTGGGTPSYATSYSSSYASASATESGIRVSWAQLAPNDAAADVVVTPPGAAPMTIHATSKWRPDRSQVCSADVHVPAGASRATIVPGCDWTGSTVIGTTSMLKGVWDVIDGLLRVRAAPALFGRSTGRVELGRGTVHAQLFTANARPICSGGPVARNSTTVSRPDCADPESGTLEYSGRGLTANADGTLRISGTLDGFVVATDEAGRQTPHPISTTIDQDPPPPPSDPLPTVSEPVPPPTLEPVRPPADSDGDGLTDSYDCAPLDPLRPARAGSDGNCNGIPDYEEPRIRTGSAGADRFVGGRAADILRGGGGPDTLIGMGGNDRLDGGAGNDRLYGGFGNDHLTGGSGNDYLAGAAGRDRIVAGAGRDRLVGGAGNDTLLGGRGTDTAIGGAGADLINVRGGGRDIVICGRGVDRVIADRTDRVARDCERVARRG